MIEERRYLAEKRKIQPARTGKKLDEFNLENLKTANYEHLSKKSNLRMRKESFESNNSMQLGFEADMDTFQVFPPLNQCDVSASSDNVLNETDLLILLSLCQEL